MTAAPTVIAEQTKAETQRALAAEDDELLSSPDIVVPGGGWTTLAAPPVEDPGSHRFTLPEPLRRHIGYARVLLGRLADADSRRALARQALDALDRAVEAFSHPEMRGVAPVLERPPGAIPNPDPSALAPAIAEPTDPAYVRAKVEAILKLLPERGDPAVPANLTALGHLLADQLPGDDFAVVDLLHDCFPRGLRNSNSRVLMAVARNLGRNFGRSGRLPMAAAKAWTMLDPELFVEDLAGQLAHIIGYCLNWQANQKTFLVLEFAEIELIEYLFEHLHPRRHAPLMARTMEIKALSQRRVGLLRRLPARLRRHVQATYAGDPAGTRTYVDDALALLDLLSGPGSYAALAEIARAARTEVEKVAEHLGKAQAAAPPAGGAPAGVPPLDQIMRGLAAPANSVTAAMPAAPAPPRLAQPPAQTPRRRYTNRQKTEAVMRVLHGEDRDWVALSLGIPADLLARWHEAFLEGGAQALAPAKAPRPANRRKAAPAEPSIGDLKAKLADLIQTVEHLSRHIEAPAAAPLALPPPGKQDESAE